MCRVGRLPSADAQNVNESEKCVTRIKRRNRKKPARTFEKPTKRQPNLMAICSFWPRAAYATRTRTLSHSLLYLLNERRIEHWEEKISFKLIGLKRNYILNDFIYHSNPRSTIFHMPLVACDNHHISAYYILSYSAVHGDGARRSCACVCVATVFFSSEISDLGAPVLVQLK